MSKRINPKWRYHEMPKNLGVPVEPMDRAIQAHAYDYLLQYAQPYLFAVEASLQEGFTPEQISDYVLRQTSDNKLALRCKQAALHILASREA